MDSVQICECCGTVNIVEPNDPDIILEPWPHIECFHCGHWIPLF